MERTDFPELGAIKVKWSSEEIFILLYGWVYKSYTIGAQFHAVFLVYDWSEIWKLSGTPYQFIPQVPPPSGGTDSWSIARGQDMFINEKPFCILRLQRDTLDSQAEEYFMQIEETE